MLDGLRTGGGGCRYSVRLAVLVDVPTFHSGICENSLPKAGKREKHPTDDYRRDCVDSHQLDRYLGMVRATIHSATIASTASNTTRALVKGTQNHSFRARVFSIAFTKFPQFFGIIYPTSTYFLRERCKMFREVVLTAAWLILPYVCIGLIVVGYAKVSYAERFGADPNEELSEAQIRRRGLFWILVGAVVMAGFSLLTFLR